MKRDLDLLRKLLLAVESKPDLRAKHFTAADVDSTDELALIYHGLLAIDAGLIEGERILTNTSDRLWVKRLTPAGHDLIDNIRSDSVWRAVLRRLSEVGGGASLDVVKSLAVAAISGALGLK